MVPSLTISSMSASSGSRMLRPGDWRRAAAAETGGEPVEAPRYAEYTPNIDDVHSPASVNFDYGAGPGPSSPLLPRALDASSDQGLGGTTSKRTAELEPWDMGFLTRTCAPRIRL
jgi:hypothetical protein